MTTNARDRWGRTRCPARAFEPAAAASRLSPLPGATAAVLAALLALTCACDPRANGHGEEHGHDEEHGHEEHPEHGRDDHGDHGHDEHGDHGHDGHDGHADESSAQQVRLSAAAVAASGIVVGPVERRALSGRAGWPAELRFDPQSTGHVTLPAPGRIVSVDVELGQEVTRGEVLGVATSAAASQVLAERERVRARLAAAEAALTRHRQLREEGIGSARAVIDAEAEVAALRAELRALAAQARVMGATGGRLRLRAPLDGVVVHVGVTRGEVVGVNDIAFTVADPRAISVYGEIPEMSVGEVRRDLRVLFRPHAFRELAVPGTVVYVAPSLDVHTRTLLVRVRLDELDPRLRSGMYGSIELVGDEDRVLAVPTSAVVTLKGAPTVFVPGDEEGVFEPRPVQIGRRAGRFYELLSGIEEGARIVVAGAFTLKGALSSEGFAEHHH